MSSRSPAHFQQQISELIARRDLVRAATAAAAYRAAWPSSAAGWLLGSIVALLAEDRQTALALIEEPLRVDPADGQCLLQKAECLLGLGRRAEALAAAEAAGATAKVRAALDAVGEFLSQAGEYARALVIYNRAVALAPRDPTLLTKRAVIHRFLGHHDLAARDYESVLAIAPGTPKALKGRVELHRQSHEHNSIDALRAALAAAASGSTDAAILHFGLAKSYEDLGEHAESWRHVTAGNRIERSRIQYSPENDRDVIEGLIEGFSGPEPPSADSSGERPIFIVGVPRTGSTLVDRILSSHSQVHSAGEATAMPEAIDALARRSTEPPEPDLRRHMAQLGKLQGKPLAAEYLSRVRAYRGERPRFTDKQLTNFAYCPLILRAFPGAHILHVTRHPLATCAAIYRTRFNGGQPFAYDLAEIAEFYVGYRRLMAHWHRLLPGRILDVAYEDVVTALEPTTRRMLDELGLPFEPACLEFHLNPAPVITTSSVQVRQPLYASSLDQWKHYAAELAPVRARLERAGIPID
ncbi:MAG TPA: sulfotransferase [Steroidobacteraceae bacterium]|nr:sulfotransferase [Steroidobacteraceae bacterium]